MFFSVNPQKIVILGENCKISVHSGLRHQMWTDTVFSEFFAFLEREERLAAYQSFLV